MFYLTKFIINQILLNITKITKCYETGQEHLWLPGLSSDKVAVPSCWGPWRSRRTWSSDGRQDYSGSSRWHSSAAKRSKLDCVLARL